VSAGEGGFMVGLPTFMVMVANGPCDGPEVVSTSRHGLFLIIDSP